MTARVGKGSVTLGGVDRKAENLDEWFRLWMMTWPPVIRRCFSLPSYLQVAAVAGSFIFVPTAIVEGALLIDRDGRVEGARQAGEFDMAKRAELGIRGLLAADDLPPGLRGAIADQRLALQDQTFRAEQSEQLLSSEKEAREKLADDLAKEREQRLKADKESDDMRRILLQITAGAK